MEKRKVEVVIISDIHLGTYGCQATSLLQYLKSIDPETLILNGDIVDIWNFSKNYFPKTHIHIIRQILKMTEKGCKTYYITGNHDEALRKYSGTKIGNFIIDDHLSLKLHGKKIWIFHGDIFDMTTKGWAKIVAKLGGKGYDMLIWSNKFINDLLSLMGKEKVSFSKKVKSSVKKAVRWIADFEVKAAHIAIDKNYDVVICGHIHHPQQKKMHHGDKEVLYLNSGDWIENCTALEYHDRQWHIHKHLDYAVSPLFVHNEYEEIESELLNQALIFNFNTSNEDIIFHPSHR